MSKLKPDAKVQASRDEIDSPELDESDFAVMRPMADVFPELVASYRRARGLQKAPTKQLVSLRLDRDVIEHFRASGEGWQSRMNAALRKAAKL